MLLGNKKSKPDEKNWCVVLNAIQNELDKKRFAQKIAAVFSLSTEESADLVVSTPIILLDNLSQKIAAQLKDYLSLEGAQLILTNDIFLKRKCYRTVWPEPPNLSFLIHIGESRVEEPQKLLAPDEALDALKMQKQEAREPLQELHRDMEDAVSRVQEKAQEPSLRDELKKSRQDVLILKQENARLRAELERLKKEALEKPKVEPLPVETSDRDLQELKAVLGNLEEKYEVLKEEYRDARGVFEDKIKKAALEIDQLSRKNNELSEQLKTLESDHQHKAKDAVDLSTHHKKLKDDYDQMKKVYEERLAASARAMDVWKEKTETLTRRIEELELAKPEPGIPAGIHEQELGVWKEKHSGLERELNLSIRNHQAEKSLRQTLETQLKDLEAQNEKLSAELSRSLADAQKWESQFQELDQKVTSLKVLYDEREKQLQLMRLQFDEKSQEAQKLSELLKQSREEAALREAESEARDADARIALQEERLKELVAEQETVEKHIREREETIRKILSEQQRIEKQIVEQKQRKRLLDERRKQKKSPPGLS